MPIQKKRKQAARAGAGRPKTTPPGARNRSIRLSDAEYAAVVEFVRQLRSKSQG